MMALVFVSLRDIPQVFNMFYNEVPDDFIGIANYFEVNYNELYTTYSSKGLTKSCEGSICASPLEPL